MNPIIKKSMSMAKSGPKAPARAPSAPANKSPMGRAARTRQKK